ncbi:MAG: MurR/RpiR family transcriptional regulator [Actinoallomurus sp.]
MQVGDANPGVREFLRDRVARRLDGLPPAERRVAEYIRDNLNSITFATATEIGETTGTSDATVVRTAKALGYAGLPDLKRAAGREVGMLTEPSVRLRSRIEESGNDTTTLLDHVFYEGVERLVETRRLLSEAALDAAVTALAEAREVVGYGVGPSAMPVSYLTLRLGRLGRRARAMSATGFCLADELLGLRAEDVIVLYAPGRLLRDMDVLLTHAEAVGARTILVSDALTDVLADRVQITLPAVDSASGLTQEGLSSMLVTDCLTLGVARRDAARATATSELLTSLRTRVAPQDNEPEPRRRP